MWRFVGGQKIREWRKYVNGVSWVDNNTNTQSVDMNDLKMAMDTYVRHVSKVADNLKAKDIALREVLKRNEYLRQQVRKGFE